MKEFLYLFLIFLLSCGPDQEKTEGTYSIVNESNVEVILKFPVVNGEDLLFIIPSQGSITGETLEFSTGRAFVDPEAVTPSISFGLPGDMAFLYFNNELQASYTINSIDGVITFTSPVNRNIFRNGNYLDIGDRIFEYTITQADFDAATPCDGDCE